MIGYWRCGGIWIKRLDKLFQKESESILIHLLSANQNWVRIRSSLHRVQWQMQHRSIQLLVYVRRFFDFIYSLFFFCWDLSNKCLEDKESVFLKNSRRTWLSRVGNSVGIVPFQSSHYHSQVTLQGHGTHDLTQSSTRVRAVVRIN